MLADLFSTHMGTERLIRNRKILRSNRRCARWAKLNCSSKKEGNDVNRSRNIFDLNDPKYLFDSNSSLISNTNLSSLTSNVYKNDNIQFEEGTNLNSSSAVDRIHYSNPVGLKNAIYPNKYSILSSSTSEESGRTTVHSCISEKNSSRDNVRGITHHKPNISNLELSRSSSAPDLYRLLEPGSIDSSNDSEDVYNEMCLKEQNQSSDASPTFNSTSRKRRRTRSLNAPSPIQQFGPCGRILKNQAMVMTIQDPASQRLTWYKPPLTVLVIKKIRDASVLQPFVQLVTWLIKEKRMLVFVEQSVLEDPLLLGNTDFDMVKDKLKTFKDGKDDLTDKIDFIVCLGGDGTLLYASLLFQQSVPPVMAFHLGSLGFLTPFQFDNFQEQVTNVLEGNVALTLRSRLRCVIVRKSEDGNRNSKPPTNLLVLNEVVIDRGPSPYLSNIDLFLDGKHITSVQGDGLIVSTPTGSTAYAVAAGASMIHPSVPAIMVTPICPHSLSFRPIVVPAGVELKISVSPDSRNTSWVSFDGRNRQELLHGDSLRVTTSIYPVPSICAQDQISDWFDSLAECLHWNVRKRQKHLDELSDLTHSSSNDTLNSYEHSEHISDT